MSYTPTAEKLTSLGYTLQPDRDGFGRQEYTWGRRRITTWLDAPHLPFMHVAFMEHQGLNPNPVTCFSVVLPSEDFFDQLLVALDWHPPKSLLQ